MKTLEVHIWNVLVGILSFDRQKQKTYFEYSQEYLDSELELSPIIYPKSKGVTEYDYSTTNSFKGLPAFISDSLPDKFGTEVFYAYLQSKGIKIQEISPLEQLAYRGNRAMGALEFIPSKKMDADKLNFNLSKLSEISNQITNKKLIGNFDKGMFNLFELGTSPGGAQPKILINKDKNGTIFRGDILPTKNQTSWILKFNNPTGDFGIEKGKIEYAYYLMAKKAGIEISKSELIQNNNEELFITQRFDRKNGEKIHMQTAMAFARMDWKSNSFGYEYLFKILQFINADQKDKQELFRRMIFNVLSRNIDDHTKNFSFIMNENGNWKLAPAYDLVFTAKYGFSQPNESHFLSINGKHNNITFKDVETLAKSFSVKRYKEIIDEVNFAVKQWKSIADEINISSENRDFVGSKLLGFPFRFSKI